MALSDTLADLLEELDEAEDEIGSLPGPLPDPPMQAVARRLTAAQAKIAAALHTINYVGAPDGVLPSTLPLIADECVTQATKARDESQKTSPSNTVIGNHIKTINRILDIQNGYRSRAGIT